MSVRPPFRVLPLALAAALLLAAGSPLAQPSEEDVPDGTDGPVVVDIRGPCAVALDDRPTPCSGVAYMAYPSTGRIDFTAIGDAQAWAFSGENDGEIDGRYVLMVDSVTGPSTGRVEAEGECDMELADDRRTVKSLECAAMTAQGALTLQASGVAAEGPDSVAPGEDQDEDQDDDEGDAPPDEAG